MLSIKLTSYRAIEAQCGGTRQNTRDAASLPREVTSVLEGPLSLDFHCVKGFNNRTPIDTDTEQTEL